MRRWTRAGDDLVNDAFGPADDRDFRFLADLIAREQALLPR